MTRPNAKNAVSKATIALDMMHDAREALLDGRTEWYGADGEPPDEVANWIAIWFDIMRELVSCLESDVQPDGPEDETDTP